MELKLSKLPIALMMCVLSAVTVVELSAALQTCGGSCASNDDCTGQLACISRKCNDDPAVGTHICGSSRSGGGGSGSGNSPCTASSYLTGTGHSCNTAHGSDCCIAGKKYAQYSCSPAVTATTPAVLTLNGFESGEDGGGPSECDGKFHSNKELVVALSSGWYDKGRRCGKKIRIKAANGRSVLAKVVDECDSVNGCDSEHDYQPPCPYNDVDASQAVWDALGLNSDNGQVSVTWSDP